MVSALPHMPQIVNQSQLCIDSEQLALAGISPSDFNEFFPSYIREATVWRCSWTGYTCMKLVQTFFRFMLRICLRPRKGPVGELSPDEVEQVYNREASSYDRKHHATTYGMDTTWRRAAGFHILSLCRSRSPEAVHVLDLCTGTGLVLKEIMPILSHWAAQCRIIGLDYNERMLSIARSRQYEAEGIDYEFVRGNALELVHPGNGDGNGSTRFAPGSFDVVTQVLGIGGIADAVGVFRNVIQVLRQGGKYFLMDMHRPIAALPGEWPTVLRWCRFPWLETVTYDHTTIPLALNRLWGWRDTTLDFYLLPLVTWRDSEDKSWGFQINAFEVESHRWWLGLPIMPVAKLIVEKVAISDSEATRRERILAFSMARAAGSSCPDPADQGLDGGMVVSENAIVGA